jgi:hypothetical protein
MSALTPNETQPWWKFGHVWLVVSGPLAVVLACVVTFFVAVQGRDPVVDENYYQAGLALTQSGVGRAQSVAPAVQARNHAATGLVLTQEKK